MKTLNLFIITAFILALTSCKKENKTFETDYNFPFTAEVSLEPTLLQNTEYAVILKLTDDAKISNPNNNYTISYVGNNVLLRDQSNNIIAPNTEVKFTFDNPPIIKLESQQLGTQSITFTIKNANGYVVTKTITYNTIESSIKVSTTERIFNTFTNTDISFKFSVSQDIPSQLSLKFENVSNDVTIKLNGQEVSRLATVVISPNIQNELNFSYKSVSDNNPKIIISDANNSYPIELSVSVKPRVLEFSNIVLQRRTNVGQNIFVDVTNVEEYVSTNVYNLKADINTVSSKLKVNIQSTRQVIKEIHYNGQIYQVGDNIILESPSDFSKLLIYFRNTDFGETTLRVKVTDDWNTTSNELTTSFVLYNKVTVNTNTLSFSNLVNKITNSTDINNNALIKTSPINIESLGNPITSINANINGSISAISNVSDFSTLQSFPFLYNGVLPVNNEVFSFVYTFNSSHLTKSSYKNILVNASKISNSSIIINRTYGSPIVVNLTP